MNAVSRSHARKDMDRCSVTLWQGFGTRCSLQAVTSPRNMLQEISHRKATPVSNDEIMTFAMCRHHLPACACARQEYVERVFQLVVRLFEDKEADWPPRGLSRSTTVSVSPPTYQAHLDNNIAVDGSSNGGERRGIGEVALENLHRRLL